MWNNTRVGQPMDPMTNHGFKYAAGTKYGASCNRTVCVENAQNRQPTGDLIFYRWFNIAGTIARKYARIRSEGVVYWLYVSSRSAVSFGDGVHVLLLRQRQRRIN